MAYSVAPRLRPGPRRVRTIHVRVRGGYEPAVLRARVGEPVRIVFSREETAACSERVVFPAFGRSAMLPPFEDVSLELVPERAGEYEFTCQLGMLRGRLVVQGDAPSVVPAFDTVLVALATWLCTLPLLLLVGVPRLGWRDAGVSALLWLGVLATACFALCALRRSTGVGEDRRSLRRPLLHAIGTWPSRDLRRTGRH